MSRQIWARGVWGIAVSVATSAVAIAALPPQQNGVTPQQQPQSQNRAFGRAGGNRMAAKPDLDHFFVKVLMQANKDEIEMGKLAEQRSSNAAIKQLAQQMVQDHTRFMKQLESLKDTGYVGTNPQAGHPKQTQGGAAFRGNTPPAADQQSQPQTSQQTQPQTSQETLQRQLQQLQNSQNTQRPTTGNNQPAIAPQQASTAGRQTMAGQQHHEHMMGEHGAASHFAKVMEEVDRNMQQSLMRELSSKQGTEFDRCYLTGQMFGHMWVVEALKTFERDASPQLKPILQEGLQASEQHLTHIKSLLARTENESKSNAQLQPRTGRVTR